MRGVTILLTVPDFQPTKWKLWPYPGRLCDEYQIREKKLQLATHFYHGPINGFTHNTATLSQIFAVILSYQWSRASPKAIGLYWFTPSWLPGPSHSLFMKSVPLSSFNLFLLHYISVLQPFIFLPWIWLFNSNERSWCAIQMLKIKQMSPKKLITKQKMEKKETTSRWSER